MIHVVIVGPAKNGWFPYRVDWYFEGRPQLTGLSPTPLLDACRQLKQMGLMDSTVVGLFYGGENQWRFRTTVGYGARNAPEHRVEEARSPAGARRATMIDDGIKGTPDMNVMPDLGDAATSDAPPATPAEEPPEPHTRPEHQAGKGQAHAEPDKPKQPHRKRKPAKSGARRGQR